MHIPDHRDREVAQRYFKPFIPHFQNCKNVLEVASGQGFFLEEMVAANIPAQGLELDKELCKSMQARDLPIEQGDLFERLANHTGPAFDGCMASHIVEHFLPEQVDRMLGLLHGVTSEGGVLVLITPNMANLRRASGDFWRDPTHVRPYPVSALSKLLQRNGWEVVSHGEHTDRVFSLKRKVIYGLRNLLLGRYWGGDDLYVVARRV
ncbi:class I SAM-dependent methyltransferase [Magnetococcus sp. PR-3]|uniref:class I SAM-dependent methyltransferase n=1 Tax=Magnetococcus sp. PR-3 TaxID=3120355 RepID=UPI002FCE0FA6